METNQYEYYAFISYKREDEKWAKWLQKKLESYGFPVSLRKDNPALPSKIRPVFRDQSELSGGNLKEEIEKGLKGSKYLIVICSLRSAHSPRVSKEVQYFIDKGKENYIIPFIIGGVPNSKDSEDECFPEGLRQLSDDKEILGININEMGRDAAAIKIIARMFNLRFDSLWQRYKRAKRIKTFSYILATVVLLVLAVIVAIILWTKNQTIANQNNQLTLLVENLKEENKTFSKMRHQDERYSYVGSLRGVESNNDFWAIAYHPYKPLLAFIDDWGVWLHNISTNTETLLLTNNNGFSIAYVEWMNFSDDGSKLIIASHDYSILNIVNGKLQTYPRYSDEDIETPIPKLTYDNEDLENYELSDLNKMIRSYIEIKDDYISVYKGKGLISTKLGSIEYGGYSLLYNEPNMEVLIIGENRITVYDDNNHKFVQFFRGYNRFDVGMNKRGSYLRIGKDIFVRNNQPDTIQCISYKANPIEDFPKHCIQNNNESIKIDDQYYSFTYNYKNISHKIEVVKEFSRGTAQETISNIVFAQPDEIIVIMECGKHRIFNADTEELVGILDNYADITHRLGMNVAAKVIGRDLYAVSADGTFCIYNLDNQKIKKVVVIPVPRRFDPDRIDRIDIIDKCEFSVDGKSVSYAFENDSVFYEFKLP